MTVKDTYIAYSKSEWARDEDLEAAVNLLASRLGSGVSHQFRLYSVSSPEPYDISEVWVDRYGTIQYPDGAKVKRYATGRVEKKRYDADLYGESWTVKTSIRYQEEA